MEETQKWLTDLVRGLVANKDAVKVDVKEDHMGVLFTVHVDDSDAAKVVGREGKTAKAVRTLLYCVGYAHDMRASVKFDVPSIGGINSDE